MLKAVLVALGIAAVCVVIHITTLITLVERLLVRKSGLDRGPRFRHFTPLLLLLFSVIMILHVFEACIWAAFYGWYKLFPDWETSIYFSVVSYATIGYGDVVLPETWRLLGAIEGITGVLLCGVSTAFLFAIINAFFRMRVEQIQEKRSD
jgi:voltage-gated potassium channel Kch